MGRYPRSKNIKGTIPQERDKPQIKKHQKYQRDEISREVKKHDREVKEKE